MVALVGASGLGQDDAGQPAAAFLRPDRGRDAHRRHTTCARRRSTSLREQIGLVTQETVLFDDTVRNNIAYGRADVPAGASRSRSREPAQAHEFIEKLPPGLRHDARRARRAALDGPAAADHHRPGAAQGPADPDPRRGDLGAGRRVGGAGAAGAGGVDAGPDQHRHRPPPGDRAPRRPDPGARRRADRRAGHARASCWREAASTPGCTSCSSGSRRRERGAAGAAPRSGATCSWLAVLARRCCSCCASARATCGTPTSRSTARRWSRWRARGDWLVPTVNGDVFAEKPILYFWMALAVVAGRSAGSTSSTLRLPSAVAGVVGGAADLPAGLSLRGPPAGPDRRGAVRPRPSSSSGRRARCRWTCCSACTLGRCWR